MKLNLRILSSLLLAGLALPASAAAPDSLNLSCPVCHGDGRAPPQQLPRLQDLSAARIEQRLRGYRDGSLAGTAMPRLAAPLSDEDIAALAAHFGDRRR